MREAERAVVHRDHPLRAEVHKGAHRVGRVGVHVAERCWMIRADGEEGDVGRQAPSDLVKAVEIGGVTGVIERLLVATEYVSAVAAVHVADDARAPMTRRRMRDSQIADAVLSPPIEFDDLAEAE